MRPGTRYEQEVIDVTGAAIPYQTGQRIREGYSLHSEGGQFYQIPTSAIQLSQKEDLSIRATSAQYNPLTNRWE